jgi:hypothetical protein
LNILEEIKKKEKKARLEVLISKNILWNCLAKWTEIWWEAPMEGSVLSFLKVEWKVSGSAHWVSSYNYVRIGYKILRMEHNCN